MNPALQTQIFDVLRQQYVQVDGGELATISVLFQVLVEMRLQTQIAYDQARGIVPQDDLNKLRADLLNEFTFTRQA